MFNNPSRLEDKIKLLPFLCVGRLINILVLFLLQHLNWSERYSTMKIVLFLYEYLYSIEKNVIANLRQFYIHAHLQNG